MGVVTVPTHKAALRIKSWEMLSKETGVHPSLGKLSFRTGNPLQDSRLGNPTDREAWQATVHGVAKSQTGLSD